MMSNRWHLMRLEQAAAELPQTPAARALALDLVSRMDLLRLKAVARLHARGLPPEVGWADLLQEAFARVLDGSRKCPDGLPMVVFMAGVIRSIRTEHCRRARRAAAYWPRWRAELDLCGPENEASDPSLDLERSLIAMQQLAEIERLFADDFRALKIIEGLFEGWSPEQIRVRYDMSKTEYDSTRKRMRRTLLKEGLRWAGHEV
jgi:RNA polymerase sigma-70 factor (ECF subfamily)